MLYGIRIFEHIFDRKFQKVIHHKPLKWLFSMITKTYHQNFSDGNYNDHEIIYEKGKKNTNADALSRQIHAIEIEQTLGTSIFDYHDLRSIINNATDLFHMEEMIQKYNITKMKSNTTWKKIFPSMRNQSTISPTRFS